MLTIYRTAWLDSRDLRLEGYIFFSSLDLVKEFVEDFYQARAEGDAEDIISFSSYAQPVHNENKVIVNRMVVPESGLLREALEPALDDPTLYITISPASLPEMWHEIRTARLKGQVEIPREESEELYPFDVPSNVIALPRRPATKPAEAGGRHMTAPKPPQPMRG